LLRGLVRAGVEVRALGEILLPELGLDVLTGHLDRLAAEVRRIGSHVGDQGDGALAGDLDALVELLSRTHRALRVEAKAAARGLLEGRGDVRGARAARGPLGLDARD